MTACVVAVVTPMIPCGLTMRTDTRMCRESVFACPVVRGSP